MKRVLRIAAIAAAIAGGVVAIALTALNLYVQSQGTQERIQQELSQRLGATVRINAVSVTPWGGLRLSGITIPSVTPNIPRDFLQAEDFQLHLSIFSLFSKKLLVKRVALLHPTVIWPQNEEGKWRLPGGRKERKHREREAMAAPPSETTPDAAAAETPAGTAPPSMVVESPSPGASPGVEIVVSPGQGHGELVPDIRRLYVEGGNFRFLDRGGGLVASFEDVNFNASVHQPGGLRGNTKIGRMSARDRFFLENLHSILRYDPDELELSQISASAGGGNVTGSFVIETEAEGSPFKTGFKFHNVEADQIVSDAGGPHGMIQGKLEGEFDATGKTADLNSALDGKGEIFLRDGQVRQYSLLVALGQMLQIEELQQLRLEQADAKYHVSPGLVTIDELILRSPNIHLSATGTITFDGKLRLNSQLAINDRVRNQLFKPLRENFKPIAEAGYSGLDFEVGGTVDRPKTNLVDRVIGRDLKDIVSGLFGGGKKSDKQKKKKQRDETEASPEETPVVAAPEASPAPADITAPLPSPTP